MHSGHYEEPMDSPKITFRRHVILLSSLLLAGCVLNTADTYYGSGPLKLVSASEQEITIKSASPFIFPNLIDGLNTVRRL